MNKGWKVSGYFRQECSVGMAWKTLESDWEETPWHKTQERRKQDNASRQIQILLLGCSGMQTNKIAG